MIVGQERYNGVTPEKALRDVVNTIYGGNYDELIDIMRKTSEQRRTTPALRERLERDIEQLEEMKQKARRGQNP